MRWTRGLTIPDGAARRQILVRAAGQALASLGAGDALSDPAVAVIDREVKSIASNDDWASDNTAMAEAATRAGAIPVRAESKDAALIL